MIVTAPIRAATHTNNPPRFWHLVIYLSQCGGHLVGQGSSHDHDIRLPGRRSENDTESILIVAWCRQVHHFYGTAGKSECHRPQRTLACPIRNLIKCSPVYVVCQQTEPKSRGNETNSAYCIGPSFFSWLGSGTSLRTFPVAVRGVSELAWCSRALARFRVDVDMYAEGLARMSVLTGWLTVKSHILTLSEIDR